MKIRKTRIEITVDEPRDYLRVVPHKHDDSKLMIKSKRPESGAMFCEARSVTFTAPKRGSAYFMVEVDKAAFMAAVADEVPSLKAVMADPNTKYCTPDVPEAEEGYNTFVAQYADEESEDSAAETHFLNNVCVECGCSDGLHAMFCPHHIAVN